MSSRLHPDVEAYLQTGTSPESAYDWPGQNIIERQIAQHEEMSDALLAAVRTRAAASTRKLPAPPRDLKQFTRRKVEPMVAGLFPEVEREPVLRMLEKSVVFLAPENIERVIGEEVTWPHTAWNLANLYLASVGAEMLSDEAVGILGLSEHTTCYVTLQYFGETSPLADFLVHEAAHTFHNCKRDTVGLKRTRRREWLLDIEFRKREPFAYSCEAYSRLRELGRTRAERAALLEEHARCPMAIDGDDDDEYIDILREAVGARNGFKRILKRCAPPPRRSRALAAQLVPR